jgi:hypothetical protein
LSDSQPSQSLSGPAARAHARPHISEWFGHRVFPVVSASPAAVSDQRAGRCPFLSGTLNKSTTCVKAENSRGVCTISATSNGHRQDWLVCPYRALDDSLLSDMVRRLYGVPGHEPVLVRPVLALREDAERTGILDTVHAGGSLRVFCIFRISSVARSGYPRPRRRRSSRSVSPS